MKTRNILITFLVILLIVGLGSSVYYFAIYKPTTQAVVTSSFVKPSWARLECLPTDAYEGIDVKWLDQQTLFKCDGFTEKCEFKIENTRDSILSLSEGKYAICNLDGGGCANKINYRFDRLEISSWMEIPSGKSIQFDSGILVAGEDDTKVTLRWKPWKLYRFVGGAKFIVNSFNCDITSGAKSKIRQEDYPSVGKLFRTGGTGMKWINYVDDWNFGPPTNVFTHSNYGEVYCSAGQIFDIIELRMEDGSLRKVDPGYSQSLPDGDILSGLGSRLSNVECCPNEPNCQDDFTYASTPIPDRECTTDIQCFNSGNPVPKTPTSYTTWGCNVDGICVESAPIIVECTSSAHCSSGQICDLSTLNYGKCINQNIGSYCGDRVCDLDESFKTCPSDCDAPPIECKWFESYYEKETCGFSPLCWIGVTSPETTKGCKLANWIYLAIGSVILVIIIIILILKFKPKK